MKKDSIVLYAYYEMISSYFKSYEVVNKYVEKSLYLYFMDAKDSFQEECEEFCIYGIENILPTFIGNFNLEDYNALISIDKENSILHIKTEAFKFDVVVSYEKEKPSIFYKNIKLKENGEWIDSSNNSSQIEKKQKKLNKDRKPSKEHVINSWQAEEKETTSTKKSITTLVREENSKMSKKDKKKDKK